MGRLALIGLFALSLAAAHAQDIAKGESNIACVARLSIPDYPTVPRLARISATITAIATLGPNGDVREFKTAKPAPSMEKLFMPSIEKAVRESVFLPKCAASVVTIIFHFELSNSLPINAVAMSFGYPNEFWITGGPALAHY